MVEQIDSYLALVVSRSHQYLHMLVWCGKEQGWVGIEEAESTGFRGATQLTNRSAWQLQNEMQQSGFLTGTGCFPHKDLELCVKRLGDRPIYVFYHWDGEEGATQPIAKIRCDNVYAAGRYFQSKYAGQWESALQVRHIGDCFSDWAAIAQFELERDLLRETGNP